MANPTFTNLTSNIDTVDRVAYTTASVSPTANRLIIVSIAVFDTSTTPPPTPTSVVGNGITYALVDATNGTAIMDGSGSDRATVFMFRGMSASPSAGTIVITFSAAPTDGIYNACAWSVDQSSSDVDTTGSNGSGAIGNTAKTDDSGSATSRSANITIGASNSGFATLGYQLSAAGATPRASWTELADVAGGSTGLETQYRAASDTAVSGTHASARSGIIGAEIKQASGGTSVTLNAATETDVATALTVNIPGLIDGIEPESSGYVPPIIDSNGNLYRITESYLAENNQPKAMKSTDGGVTWVEQDAANRPGTDTSSIGDLESGWVTWDATDKTITFTWQRSFVAYSQFRTSDHATNPDTWVSNTRENIAALTGSPQYASHTSPTDQAYEWIFYNNSTTKPSYRSRTNSSTYGTQADVDTAGQHPAAILAPNGTDTYILYRKTNDLVFKKLTSGGTLDSSATRVDTNGVISTTPIGFAAPQMYAKNGNTYLGALFCNSSTAPRFVLVTNGTAGSEEVVSANGVLQDPGATTNQSSVMSLAVDSTGTFHALWSDASTGDVKYNTRPIDGAWGTESTLVTLAGSSEADWIYAKVLTNPSGTRLLAFTYDQGPHLDDDSNIFYRQFVLPMLNPAIETDAAGTLTVGLAQNKTLVTATETDVATLLTATETRTLTGAAETDVATPLTATEARTLTGATETDVATTLTAAEDRTLIAAAETDVATPLTATEVRTLTGAAETDVATALSVNLATGKTLVTATETDVATTLTATEAFTLTSASESDVATSLTTTESRTLTGAAETDAATTLSVGGNKVLTTAVETDTATPLTAGEPRTLSGAAETDVATSLSTTEARTLGTAAESDVAVPLAAVELRVLVTAAETDAAGVLSRLKTATLTTAVELDLAGSLFAITGVAKDTTVIVGPPRVGSITVGGPRTGTVTIGGPRTGSVTTGGPRMGSVEVGDTRTERGPH